MDHRIIEFLIRAKRATYAGKGSETTPSRLNSKDLIYKEDNMMYYDTYIGGKQFAGEEALWINDIPYWSMNYVGRVVGDNFSGDFLKEALYEVPMEYPYRGPSVYKNIGYEYANKVNGNFQWFQGYETISYEGNIIYECHYHGSMIE